MGNCYLSRRRLNPPAQPPTRLDDLMEPADRGALAGLAVGLELGVPVAAEQLVDPEGQLGPGRGGQQVAEPVLPHKQVAVGADGGPEDAEVGRHGVPLAITAGAGLLGDLVAQDAPASQRTGQASGGAAAPAPD